MDTLITSVEEKLPETVRRLLAETAPLPRDTVFFEQRFTVGAIAGRFILGVALLAVGALLALISIVAIFTPSQNTTVSDTHQVDWWFFGIGAVMGFAGWTLASSLPGCLALRRRQAAGERTRYGIFLTPEALVSRSYFDTTMIPRERFSGLKGSHVQYTFKNETKSFALPHEWTSSSTEEVQQAILSWNQSAAPPPQVEPA